MSSQEDRDFADLMQRVMRRSDAAAKELVERFGPRVLRMVRKHLPRALRSKYDSVDFVQAVWASFFVLPPDRLRFNSPDALGPYLGEMAANKVVDVIRQRLRGARHNTEREQIVEEINELAKSMPSPEAIAIAREEWSKILRNEPSHNQRMLKALAEGRNTEEVARQHGFSPKTVKRLVRRMRREQGDKEQQSWPN